MEAWGANEATMPPPDSGIYTGEPSFTPNGVDVVPMQYGSVYVPLSAVDLPAAAAAAAAAPAAPAPVASSAPPIHAGSKRPAEVTTATAAESAGGAGPSAAKKQRISGADYAGDGAITISEKEADALASSKVMQQEAEKGDTLSEEWLPPAIGVHLSDQHLQLLLYGNVLMPKRMHNQVVTSVADAKSQAWAAARVVVLYPMSIDLVLDSLQNSEHAIRKSPLDERIVLLAMNLTGTAETAATASAAASASSAKAKAGIHWVSLILDGQRKVIVYHDSLGHGMSGGRQLQELRRLLMLHFPGWSLSILSETTQDDGWSCGWWVVMTLTQYCMYVRAQLTGAFSICAPIRDPSSDTAPALEYARRLSPYSAHPQRDSQSNRMLLNHWIKELTDFITAAVSSGRITSRDVCVSTA